MMNLIDDGGYYHEIASSSLPVIKSGRPNSRGNKTSSSRFNTDQNSARKQRNNLFC